VAAYGSERGREATAEALAYAWEHWKQVREAVNQLGLLYRVGQSRTRTRKTAVAFEMSGTSEVVFEPGLLPALEELTEAQRTAVVLVYGFGWTMKEVGDMTGVKVTSVQNHLNRALKKLRAALKVGTDA
jgi:DNA-directed RNA polymerase specialized sigma24 family protein